MKRLKLHRATFILAGIYNILWGLWVSVDPDWLFRFAGMELPNYPEIFVCVGMVVGLYGIVYLEIARRPERGFILALVGFLGKIFGPIGMVYYMFIGKWTFAAIIMNVTNDFIWLIPFAIYLYDAFPFFKTDLKTDLTKKTERILITNYSDKPLLMMLEPWGEDYTLLANEEFEIIAEDCEQDFYYNIVPTENCISVYAEGNEYPRVYKDGVEIDCGYNREE